MSLSSLKFMQCGYMGSSSRDSFSSQSSTAPTSVKAEPNETSKGDKPPTDSPAHHRDTSHTTKYSFRPEFVTIPISSAASISSPFCSAAGVNCFGSPDDAKKRAAAAEARRRRRNLLAKRQTSNSPRRSLRRGGGTLVVPFQDSKRLLARDQETSICCYPLIQPTVDGVEVVGRRWKNGFVVAVPTECTYEACLAIKVPARSSTQQSFDGIRFEWQQKVDQLCQITQPPLAAALQDVKEKNPYCVLTPGSELRRHPILRECFVPHLYALRATNNDKPTVMYRFNECMEILKRLASKLWPGPVLIRMGLSSQSPWAETPFVSDSGPPGIGENDNTSDNPYLPPYQKFVTLRCPRHPLAVKARKDITSDDNTFLISLPVSHSPGISTDATSLCSTENENAFCTRARQVASRMAVLDGEDCREVFHVPTCEYLRPCQSVLWLDGRQRKITLQPSSEGVCSKSVVQAAIRYPASKRWGNKEPRNRKEKMLVQAIVNKWKIIGPSMVDMSFA